MSFKATKSLTIPPVEIKLCLWARSTVPAFCPRVRGDRREFVRTCYLLLLETSPRCQMVMISDFCLKVPGSSPGVGTMAWVPASDLELMLN
jgi:hypothetical protein